MRSRAMMIMGGAIPDIALDEGCKLARFNALQFLKDAELLLEHGSHGHAVALANYALEEYGKMGVLRAMKLEPKLHTLQNERSAMHDHQFKIAIVFKGLTAPAPVPDELRMEIVEFGEKSQGHKERGLYVDYRAKWLSPQSEDLARNADQIVSSIKQLIERLEAKRGTAN